MKNILIALFLLATLNVFGQNLDANTEAYLTYGTNFLPFNNDSNDELTYNPEEDFGAQWPINYHQPKDLISSSALSVIDGGFLAGGFLASRGNITIGYNIRKENHVVGGMINFERQLWTQKFENISGRIPWSDSKMRNWSLAARYHYNWVNGEKLKLYSGISAGAGVRRSKTEYYFLDSEQNESFEMLDDFFVDKTTEFIYHLHANAIGLRYGKDWGLIVELGLGSRGYVNIGLNHHLFTSDKWAK